MWKPFFSAGNVAAHNGVLHWNWPSVINFKIYWNHLQLLSRHYQIHTWQNTRRCMTSQGQESVVRNQFSSYFGPDLANSFAFQQIHVNCEFYTYSNKITIEFRIELDRSLYHCNPAPWTPIRTSVQWISFICSPKLKCSIITITVFLYPLLVEE